MTAYVAIKPKGWLSETANPESRPTCEVVEEDRGPIPTGILNQDGVPIYRQPEPRRIGFIIRG